MEKCRLCDKVKCINTTKSSREMIWKESGERLGILAGAVERCVVRREKLDNDHVDVYQERKILKGITWDPAYAKLGE